QYLNAAADPLYERETEDRQMLFRPLFLTAFLLEDYLTEGDLFGASAVVLTSASSKTAIGLASLLSKSQRAPDGVIGLTSRRNAGFVEGLGCYDRVVVYDDVRSIPAATPVAIVDMAGDAELRTSSAPTARRSRARRAPRRDTCCRCGRDSQHQRARAVANIDGKTRQRPRKKA